jgi:hypothetical protein
MNPICFVIQYTLNEFITVKSCISIVFEYLETIQDLFLLPEKTEIYWNTRFKKLLKLAPSGIYSLCAVSNSLERCKAEYQIERNSIIYNYFRYYTLDTRNALQNTVAFIKKHQKILFPKQDRSVEYLWPSCNETRILCMNYYTDNIEIGSCYYDRVERYFCDLYNGDIIKAANDARVYINNQSRIGDYLYISFSNYNN